MLKHIVLASAKPFINESIGGIKSEESGISQFTKSTKLFIIVLPIKIRGARSKRKR